VFRQDSFYKASVDIGEPVIAPLESERRTLLIKPKKVQRRRIPIVSIHWVACAVKTEFITFAVDMPLFHPAARQAPRKAAVLVKSSSS